jgi:hypothetical protein
MPTASPKAKTDLKLCEYNKYTPMNFFRGTESSSKTILKSQNETYYFIKLRDFHHVFSKVKIWRFNRAADETRVASIRKYYIDNDTRVVPGCISGWVFGNVLEIYDGWHRYSACMENGDSDMFIYIKVLHTTDMKSVMADFKNINQSVSVPELYFEDGVELKKEVCEKVAKRLCDEYPECRSPSRNPQPQNFNRDNFIDLLSSLNVDYYIENLEIKLWNEIIGLNKEAHYYVKSHNIKTPKKCDYYRFWLFYLNRDYIKSKLESVCV